MALNSQLASGLTFRDENVGGGAATAGGLLGGVGGDAAGVDGSGEGAWALATPAEGFLAAPGTGELAHLLHLCLFRASPRAARV